MPSIVPMKENKSHCNYRNHAMIVQQNWDHSGYDWFCIDRWQFNQYDKKIAIYYIIVMEPVLATVSINLGLGTKNPTLLIKPSDSLPALIDKLIQDHKLPKTVQPIILQAVHQELAKNNINKPQPKSQLPDKKANDRSRSRSPQPFHNTPRAKLVTKSPKPDLKENNRNAGNFLNQTTKGFRVPSRSPAKNTGGGPIHSRVQLKVPKNPPKEALRAKDPQRGTMEQSSERVRKLFKYLTKDNPRNVKVLSPEHIDLGGFGKDLLKQMQLLFQMLEQQEFQRMQEDYFMERVEALGLIGKLGRKEFESYYLC